MKKFCLLILSVLLSTSVAFASDIDEVRAFFNAYVNASNNYDVNYFSYYLSKPTIIRVVEKKDGTTEDVEVPFATYKKEGALAVKIGKLRKYKNNYSNISVTPVGEDYKLSASRTPSTSKYSLPVYFVIAKDSTGAWKIKKEVMHTKVQAFLKRKNKEEKKAKS